MPELEELERLQILRDQGALTEAEFLERKARLFKRRTKSMPLILVGAACLVLGAFAGLAWQRARGGSPSDEPAVASSPPPSATLPASDSAPGKGSATLSTTTRLSKIFQHDMLGAQVRYLESIIGPAKHMYGGTRSYDVDGCDVTVGTDGAAVSSLGLAVNERCSFNIRPFFGSSLGQSRELQANRLTFGLLDKEYPGGAFRADCLRSCGNAYDPPIYWIIEGGRVDNFNNLLAETTLNTEDALAAANRWENAMAVEGEDYIISAKFNCDSQYDPAAHKAFRKVKVQRVTVGSRPTGLPSCAT